MDLALKQLLTLGRGYFEKKQYERAEKYLSQIVEQNQSFADVYNMLGVIYHDVGQFSRAQQCFEEALKINPAYTEASLNLAHAVIHLATAPKSNSVYRAIGAA